MSTRTAAPLVPARPTTAVPRRERGVSLLEAALALIILAAGLAMLSQVISDDYSRSRDKATADRLLEVYNAAQNYIQVNFTTLVATIAVGQTAQLQMTNGDPALGSLSSLQAGAFLPSTFVNTNPYGQRHDVLVSQPVAGQLEALVITDGGTAIDNSKLPLIAAKTGAMGGFVANNPPLYTANTVVGAYGVWQVPTGQFVGNGGLTPTVGHLAATLGFSGGQLASNDFLYRHAVANHPEVNRLETETVLRKTNSANVTSDVALSNAVYLVEIHQPEDHIPMPVCFGTDTPQIYVSVAAVVDKSQPITGMSATADVPAGANYWVVHLNVSTTLSQNDKIVNNVDPVTNLSQSGELVVMTRCFSPVVP